MANYQTPTIQELQAYGVNVADAASVIYQPLYDTLAYPTAGTPSLTFFQRTAGAVDGGLEMTNMEVAGALPTPKNMLVRAIEILPVGFSYDDLKALEARGHVSFKVGTGTYLDEVGLAQFPTQNHVDADFAVANDTAAADIIKLENAYYCGRLFKIEPVRLEPNMNFSLSINFEKGNVALPSGATDALLRVRLLGHQFRLAQV